MGRDAISRHALRAALQPDGTGLRTHAAFAGRAGDMHHHAGLEILEAIVDHRRAVEIEAVALGKLDEAVIFQQGDLLDAAGFPGALMRFDIPAGDPRQILELALRRVEA